MNYHWSDCGSCRCHLAVNWMVRSGEILGSVRRWSADRSINDGKPFQIPAADRAAPILVSCVCGAAIPLPDPPDAVGGERTDDLRVKLTAD